MPKRKNRDAKLTKENPAEKLLSSRFRFLNEQLYIQPANEAQKVFDGDDQAFKAYHDGYRKQLEKWPLNPLDFIIKDLNGMKDGVVIADMGKLFNQTIINLIRLWRS
jgi:hypothetical protein